MSDEGSSLFLCPHCGAFISESSTQCPNCGNLLEVDLDDENLELGLEDLQIDNDDISEKSEAETEAPEEGEGEAVTLFLCSVCGAFTGGGAETCSQCGASMLEDDDIQDDDVPPPDTEILNMLVEVSPEEEPDNFEPDIIESDGIDTEDIEPEDDFLLETLKNIESPEDVMNFVESLPDEPDEDLELDLEPPVEEELSSSDSDKENDDVLSQLVYMSEDLEDDPDEQRSTAIHAVENILSSEQSAQKDDDTIAMCFSCGAFVSESAEVCNVCGNSLKDDKKFIPVSEVPIEDQEEEQADSIIRSLLGVDKDTVLEAEEDRFQADGSLGLCTVCGAFIGENADACTVCGTHIEDMPEFMPSMDIEDKLTDNKQLALCPHCGVFIQEGATECMSCVKPIPEGAKLDMVEIDDIEQDSDEAFNRLRTFLGVEKTLEMEPVRDPSMSGLDVCPDCGAFVSLNAVSCSVCGNSLFEGGAPDTPLLHDERVECPNCGSKIDGDSPECPLCGMAFGQEQIPDLVPDGPGEDITDFLENELEDSIRRLEEKAGVELPDYDEPESVPEQLEEEPEFELTLDEPEELQSDEPDEDPPEKDELWVDDGLEELEIENDLVGMLDFDEESDEPEPIVPVPASEYYGDDDSSELDIDDDSAEIETAADEHIEPLEFIDDEPDDEIFIEPEEQEDYVEEDIVEEIPIDRDLSRFDIDARPMAKPANWATGIYVSSLAICLTIISYLIVPGDYAQGLAVVFGTFTLMGVYLLITEKGTFFKGDFKHASVFIVGCILAIWIVVHWPMGILVLDYGVLSQPTLDNLSLSASILLISVGILWIRARIRYVFTWLAGIILLFISLIAEATYSGWNNSFTSPSLLISSLGAGLVFLSLIFFMYERAINTSIESDIVRGDAHYLKHDYKRALASYNDAISTSQMKRVEVLGSPLIEYDVPWYSKGSALILMGEFEEGIKCLDMALAINPNNEVTWVNKGNAHSKLGEHDVAKECYERAISVNPFYEIAWNNLGNVMARRKEYVEALKHYNRAIKINPKYDDAWINKGYVLAKMGKKEQAVKCLSKVGSRAKVDLPGSETDAPVASDT